jgi:hypothetical protein
VVVDSGRGEPEEQEEQEEQRQAGAPTQQRVDAVAAPQRTGMVMRRVPECRIGVGAAPSQDRGAVAHASPPAHPVEMAEMAGERHQAAPAR